MCSTNGPGWEDPGAVYVVGRRSLSCRWPVLVGSLGGHDRPAGAGGRVGAGHACSQPPGAAARWPRASEPGLVVVPLSVPRWCSWPPYSPWESSASVSRPIRGGKKAMSMVRCRRCGWSGTRHAHGISQEERRASVESRPCPRCTMMRALLDQALKEGPVLPKAEAADRLILELQALVGRVTPRR